MIILSELKRLRDGLVDLNIDVLSHDPIQDRLKLIEALSDYIVQEEEKCKKNKLTFD